MIIDATNMILGRMASYVAKKALLGEKIDIVNSEKAIITGDKKQIFLRYKKRQEIGTPFKGPFYPRIPDRFVKRVVRGMLPYKKEKGKKALSKVMCYRTIPDKFKDKSFQKVDGAEITKMKNLRYVTVGRICEFLGGIKWKLFILQEKEKGLLPEPL